MAKRKINPLIAYGYREQEEFKGLSIGGGNCSCTGSKDYTADINSIKSKNTEQDNKEQALENKNQQQDAAIAALSASTASTISLIDGVAPTGVSKRYVVKQGGNEIGNIDIPTNNVIQSASYNPATKKITFVVTGGSNLEVDVQDMVGDVVQKSVYDTKVQELNNDIQKLKDVVDDLKDTLDIEGKPEKDTY